MDLLRRHGRVGLLYFSAQRIGGSWTWALHRLQLTDRTSFAALLGALLFLPWIVVIASTYQQMQQVTSWTMVPIASVDRFQAWGWNLSHVFFDMGLWPDNPIIDLVER
ncbi:MAG: hypothetical protein AAF329_01125 [Cyanobacteria bacterium P01_A01_bin.17]